MKKFVVPFLLLLLILISCKLTTKPEETVPISPYLFGQNLWLTDGAEGRPGYIEKSLWPKVKESGVKIIRIGGNAYNQKLPGFDTLSMWVKSIKEIGAEPMMQVSNYESAEKAAQVVKFFNVDNNLRITYWAIGNEPYIIHHVPIDSISKYIKASATEMKSVDPTIKIFVPDEAAYDKKLYDALLINDRTSVAGRDKNGNWYIDGVTFHNYPNAKEYSRTDVINFSVSKMRGMIINLLNDMKLANQKYQRSGQDQLLWGLTEFNITFNNPDDLSATGIAVPSFINGQFWVDIFAMSMEYGAFCVTPWCIQESDNPSSYFGYLGAPPAFQPNSSFYHMQLMAQNMSDNYVKMSSDQVFVKVFGSKNESGSTIILMNQSENKTFQFDFAAINKSNASDKIRLSAAADIKAKYSGSINPSTTMVFRFNQNGKKIKQFEYSQQMAKNNLPPQVVD